MQTIHTLTDAQNGFNAALHDTGSSVTYVQCGETVVEVWGKDEVFCAYTNKHIVLTDEEHNTLLQAIADCANA